MADPVVTIKVRYENDTASLGEAARGGAQALQNAVGGAIGGGGTGSANAALAGLNPGARPGTSDYMAQHALHNMIGGLPLEQQYIREQRGAAINSLRSIIEDRNLYKKSYNRGEISDDEYIEAMEQTSKPYARERAFLNRTKTDQYRIESRLGGQIQSAYADEDKSSARELAEANRELARTRKEAARLERSEFQASISHLSPHNQRKALLERANATNDPMEVAQLNRQAGRLARKSGLHREVMSTGMMMNLMFGGWEVASAFNAMNSTYGAEAMSSPMNALQSRYQAITQMTSGPLGAIASMGIDMPDAISRRAGGPRLGGLSNTRDAIFRAMQGIQSVQTGDQILAEDRGIKAGVGATLHYAVQARDPRPFSRQRRQADFDYVKTMLDYDEESQQIRDKMKEPGIGQEEMDRLDSRLNRRNKNRHAVFDAATRLNASERFAARIGEATTNDALYTDQSARMKMSSILMNPGAFAPMMADAVGAAYNAQGRAYSLAWGSKGEEAERELKIGSNNLQGMVAGYFRSMKAASGDARYMDFTGAGGGGIDEVLKAVKEGNKILDDSRRHLYDIAQNLKFSTQ